MFDFCIDKRTIVRYNTNANRSDVPNKKSNKREGDYMSRVAVYRTEREKRCYRQKIRRQREIRRNIILACVTAAVLMIFAFSYYSLTSAASTDTEDIDYKYFTSIQVEAGDTLWSIADEYADSKHYASNKEYIKEVKNMNKMSNDELIAGQYIIIPYYSYEFVN
jgi:LysM repeat protein